MYVNVNKKGIDTMLNLNYLKQQRQLKNYSQEYMAKQLGYKQRTEYWQFESGRRNMSLITFLNIVEILNLDLTTAIQEVSAAEGGEENV